MSIPAIPRTKILLAYTAWWGIWLMEQSFVLVQYGFDWNTALTDSLVTQTVFALAGYTINTSMHAYQPSGKHALYILGWSIALAALCVIIQRSVLNHLIDGSALYKTFLSSSLLIRGAFGWLMMMLIAVLTWFWVYVIDKQESEKRKNEAIQLAREAELSNLRQQLQPHFLFNSLNSISALVMAKPEEARKMVQQLSDFLRGTIKKDDKTMVTLEEELHHLQLYLDIEKVRFGHRLNTNIQCPPQVRELKLPSLILQPVVENAIKFGLYDTTGSITIFMKGKLASGMLEMEITNPFDEATASRTGTGFGLTAVQRRLDLLFMRNDLLTTSKNSGTFVTTIRIPQQA